MKEKIEYAKSLIGDALKKYDRVAVACSFGKDSMAVLCLARQIKPDVQVFSVMTPFKPIETFKYLKKTNKEMKLNLTVYMVADEIPKILKGENMKIKLFPTKEFKQAAIEAMERDGKKIYETNPGECCELLKVEPTKVAVKDLDAWICGLRNTEGGTRKDYRHLEEHGGLMKINPILTFTEEEVLEYLRQNEIPLHPLYSKKFSDSRRYRSLGCLPCTTPIFDEQSERDGRWQNTSKCGGECGIHTKSLRS